MMKFLAYYIYDRKRDEWRFVPTKNDLDRIILAGWIMLDKDKRRKYKCLANYAQDRYAIFENVTKSYWD